MSLLHSRCDKLQSTLLLRIHDLETDLQSQAVQFKAERERLIAQYDKLQATLLLRIHDLEADLQSQAELHREETQRLLDKILSMANPAAVREYRRIPVENMETLRNARELASGVPFQREIESSPPRSNFPGYPPAPRPPVVKPHAPAHPDIKDPEAYRKALAGDVKPQEHVNNPVPSTGSAS